MLAPFKLESQGNDSYLVQRLETSRHRGLEVQPEDLKAPWGAACTSDCGKAGESVSNI